VAYPRRPLSGHELRVTPQPAVAARPALRRLAGQAANAGGIAPSHFLTVWQVQPVPGRVMRRTTNLPCGLPWHLPSGAPFRVDLPRDLPLRIPLELPPGGTSRERSRHTSRHTSRGTSRQLIARGVEAGQPLQRHWASLRSVPADRGARRRWLAPRQLDSRAAVEASKPLHTPAPPTPDPPEAGCQPVRLPS